MDIHDLLTGHHGYAASAGVDAVFVRDVRINANIGPDAWGRNKMQPLLVSATIPYPVQQAGASDNIELTLDYRKVYKAIRLFDVGENEDNVLRFRGPMELANDIFTNLKAKDWARLDITAPKALLHTQGITMRWFGITYPRPNPDEQEIGLPSSTLSVNAMQIPCIIGIGDHERLHKQPVVVDFAVNSNAAMDEGRSIALRFRDVFNVFETSTFYTLEAFATAFARHVTVDLNFQKVAVRAYKPGVFGMADGPGVQIVRTKEFFQTSGI